MNSLKSLLFAATASVALLTPTAKAALAFDIDNTASPAFDARDFMLGYAFTVNTNVAVSGLGVFDVGSDRLASTPGGLRVGVWTSGGVLIASTTVTSASLVHDSLSTEGDWLWNAVPFNLAPGSYVAGMLRLGNTDPWMFSDGGPVFEDPRFTYGNLLETQTSTFSMPTSNLGTYGHWGPNLIFAAQTSVPDGGLTSVLMMISLGAVVAFRRKFSA